MPSLRRPLLTSLSPRRPAPDRDTSSPAPPRWITALRLLGELLPALLLAGMYLSARERELRAKPWEFAAPHSKVRIVRWLPDSSALELASGKLQQVFRPDELRNGVPLPNAYSSLDESRLFNARHFRWNTGNFSAREDRHPQTLDAIRTYAANGTCYATSNDTPRIQLYDARTGRLQRTITASDRVLSLALSADGSRLAVGNEARAEVWDVQTGTLRLTLHTEGRITRIKFSPGGTWIGTMGEESFRVWYAATGQPYRRFTNPQFGQLMAFDFSPDESTFALRGMLDHTLLLANMRTGTKQLLRSDSDPSCDVTFSPDGQWLASTNQDSVSLWDAHTATLRRTLKPLAATASPSARPSQETDSQEPPHFYFDEVKFSPDSRHLAAQGTIGKVVLWRLR